MAGAKGNGGVVRVHPVAMVKHGDVNPSAYNPRRITAAKFAALVQSIRVNGFVEPIVVQKRGMNIIGGHQRHRALAVIAGDAAREMAIPAVVLDIDERRARILNVALNNTEGTFDDDMLRKLLVGVNTDAALTDGERLATGFSGVELTRLLTVPTNIDGDDGGSAFAKSVTLSLAFDSVTERDAVKGLLAEASQRLNKKSGTIVRELLERTATPTQRKKARSKAAEVEH